MDLTGLSDKSLTQLRREKIGFVFQSFNLVPTLTARENIAYFGALQGLDTRLVAARTDELVAALDMRDFIDRRAEGFSQGQRTKTAIARARGSFMTLEPTELLTSNAMRSTRAPTSPPSLRIPLRAMSKYQPESWRANASQNGLGLPHTLDWFGSCRSSGSSTQTKPSAHSVRWPKPVPGRAPTARASSDCNAHSRAVSGRRGRVRTSGCRISSM